MPNLRYALKDQLHFRTAVPNKTDPATGEPDPNVIVTIQRWDDTRARGKRRSIAVVTHDGIQHRREICVTDDALGWLDGMLDTVRRTRADRLLSQAAAEHAILQRGGPPPAYCMHNDCSAQIPYASPSCAEGHPTESVGNVEMLSVTQRRGTLLLRTGGQHV